MSFRARILAAMLIVVAGISAAALLVAQRSIDTTWQRLSGERFENEVEAFIALRETRLRAVLARCRNLARSVRLVAAIHEGDAELLYRIGLDELRDVIRPVGSEATPDGASFFRLVDSRGRIVPALEPRAGALRGGGRLEGQIARLGASLGDESEQQVGYLAPAVDGRPLLHEVVATRIADPVTGEALGALVLGFPRSDPMERGAPRSGAIESGIWFEDRLFSRSLRGEAERQVVGVIERFRAGEAGGPWDVEVGDVVHRAFVRPLSPGPDFPPAFLVGLTSMEDLSARQAELRRRLTMAGGLAIAVGLGLSVLLAQGLSGPIRELTAGTAEIGRGNLGVRVPVRSRGEIARLTASFNEMAEGLAQKERYRGLLEVVADRDVAAAMIADRIPLEGELREVSVLFCDVRGFTALTERMEPHEVIGLLNEHMAALTRVVYAHHGVVDKFVGDSVMALFGAPLSGGEDARDAVAAACSMVAERRRLNETSRHSLSVGIGIASGPVVAGFMGAADRRNYTVLGARVNLAARLCDRAGPMEVLIDEETHGRAGDRVRVEALGALPLKGFREPVAALRVVDPS